MLNEIRNANASLVEYRLFCVYLAHLPMPKKDESVDRLSNVVTFTLADYAKIAGLKRPRKDDLKVQAANLVSMSANIPNPDGGFNQRPIWADFELFLGDDGTWMVSLECNPKIAPHIREQSGRFLRYKLYNTIFLKSYNQQRLYELLKQYEKIGNRTITLKDLRAYLSIENEEYPIWGDFSQKVLKVAQKALKENTDICFDFEPIRGKKKGRPVIAVKFTISKNKEFVDRLQIEDHLPAGDVVDYDGEELHLQAPDENPNASPDLSLYVDLFTCSLSDKDMQAVIHFAKKLIPTDLIFDPYARDMWVHDYLADIVVEMNRVSNLKSPVGWLLWRIKKDIDDAVSQSAQPVAGARELDDDEVRAIHRMMEH